ncbi:phosphate acyltransferase, partial [Xanthomonas vasicola]|uniref:phosphate acyltransferase n=1 Tax=Xanthomonas vasicola TaxID=56459 RepID=UPI001F40D32E
PTTGTAGVSSWISRRSVRKWRPATYRAYSLVRVFTDGVAIGPILMGISKPVHILTTSATSRRVMNMTAIGAVDAQIRRQRDAEKAAADKAGE